MGGDGSWRAREQGLHLKLGQALIANQGYQAAATLQTFEQALRLADEMADVSLQLPALFGLWAGHHIAGTGSADLARRYAALAETQSEAGPRLVGLRMLGLERFYEGRFADALALTDRALEIYDPILHRDLTQRFGHDPRAAAANYRAWSLWHLGFPDQAAAVIRDNLRWIREVDHANTTGLVLCFGTMTHIWLRQPDRVEAAAREALRLADEMTLPLWHAWASIHLGWALSQQGAAPGLEEIEAGLREARAIGAGRFEPFHLGLAARRTPARAGTTRPGGASTRRLRRWPGATTALSPPISTVCAAACRCPWRRAARPRPRRTFARPWRSPASRNRPSWSCAPRPASPGCGQIRTGAARPATSSLRSTAGSPRASRPRT
jgi:hypothetical protein